LILSLGERTHPVPDLMGSTLQVARLTAAQYNYEIGHISRIVMSDADKDLVIRQDPLPGSTETASPKIHLLIGEGGGGRYIMPDLTGKNLNEVEPFLTDQGFEVESIIYRFYSNVVKGTVVNHFPQPGYVVKKDDRISLEVAR
jgi:beta-lactam-binding protein with PASTA domain